MSIITIDPSLPNEATAPLYEKYDGQSQPQPAKLRMDEDGNVDVYVSGIIGSGAPEAEWNNRVLTWRLSPELSRGQVEALLSDQEVIELLERIHESHEVEWDGSNYRGRYDTELYDELQRLLNDRYNCCPEAQVLDAYEWLFGQGQPLEWAWSPDMPLDQAVEELEQDAEDNGVTLVGDIRQELINKLLDEVPDDLTGEHLRAYREHVAD